MTLKNLEKAPFPWFGGKSQAAPLVWQLLGDPMHYCEPFFGSGAVLLQRPHPCNRPYYSETVNDLDGFVCNFWRAVQWYPEQTAEAASWPVCEADKSARQIALLRWREAGAGERLAGDAAWCDPVMAGWWAWAVCVQIGAFSGDRPWVADPVTGVITKRRTLGEDGAGVAKNKPFIADNGKNVNWPGLREPGVSRSVPSIINNGNGVNRPRLFEPGVYRNVPHTIDNGCGVNRPGLREPGVLDSPCSEHGGSRLDEVDWGQYFHDRTMPEIIRWFRYLSARLRRVRILNGDWSRACTHGALKFLPIRTGKGYAGVFLDPPYPKTERADGLYAHDEDVSYCVRDWCLENTDVPWLRIVLAGFEGEFGKPLLEAGWREYEWFKAGLLRGGYAKKGRKGSQQHRERLWASPNCDVPRDDQPSLF